MCGLFFGVVGCGGGVCEVCLVCYVANCVVFLLCVFVVVGCCLLFVVD